ncbi:uncharacterized protein EI90DRAFT_1576818 [Cantharellus anzutake]|uniref:uncharacterized protein n=1 Tax=Cantharellus anzutake TaxID=1750568 RepID=UPI0019072C6F|nr:uncharacterized protein EI90DRAFT_1576818 [Cantharellus anzutake]KAF8328430.1 hypothetical protein EI90DRAFT_1576818 [Cantharellus anzutake]
MASASFSRLSWKVRLPPRYYLIICCSITCFLALGCPVTRRSRRPPPPNICAIFVQFWKFVASHLGSWELGFQPASINQAHPTMSGSC